MPESVLGSFQEPHILKKGPPKQLSGQTKRCWSVVTPGRFALQLLIPPQRWVFAQFNGRAEEESFEGPSRGGITPTHYAIRTQVTRKSTLVRMYVF